MLTISFGFLFGMKAPWFHRLSITGLTVLIVLILYTIHLIEYPFTSDVRVSPAAFESVLHRMEGGQTTNCPDDLHKLHVSTLWHRL